MKLPGSRDQQQIDQLFDNSGTIASGGTAQLVVPQSKSRSLLFIENTSTAALLVQIGINPSVATLTNGVVSSVAVSDVGFGFLVPPTVQFLGGGNSNDPATKGATAPLWPAPNNAANGHAVLANGTISSIVVDYGGSGYLVPPYVLVTADRTDPTGVGLPTATTGILLAASGGTIRFDSTVCPTSAVSIYGGTTGLTYTCKWAS